MFNSPRFIRFAIIFFCFLISGPQASRAAVEDSPKIDLERISPRVLVLRFGSSYTTQVTAISTQKGIVVVDTTYLPSMAEKMKAVIAREFGRDDFAYVINTHFHADHSFGNMAFPEAKLIAHTSAKKSMLDGYGDINAYRQQLKDRVERRTSSLKTLDPNSLEYKITEEGGAFVSRVVEELGKGFTLRTPDIEFEKELHLDMGGLNIHLKKFGDNLHTSTDIFVHIPEEHVLMTGDLFAAGWLPDISPNQTIAEQISLLEKAYSDYASVKTIIPGHYGNYDREYFKLSRDYCAKMYQRVKELKNQGKTLKAVKQELSIMSAFPEVSGLIHEFRGTNFHVANIETTWNELDKSR